MDKEDIIGILKRKYHEFTDGQKKICSYIMEHYETVIFMSAVELAAVVGVSDVTVIRFVRHLGFSGYVEFKKQLRAGVKYLETPAARVSSTLGVIGEKDDLNHQVYQKDLANLQQMLLELEKFNLQQIVDEVYRAHTIYLFGMGSSTMIADFLALHLRRMGFAVVSVSEGGAVNHEKMLHIGCDDLLITTCFPRYSKGSYQTILFAEERGAARITITDSASSILGIHSDIVIPIKIDNITFFNSYIAPLEFCHFLLMSVLAQNGKQIQRKVEQNMKSLENFDEKM